ncbi:MAG TPA: thiamine phosphate synthase [Gemmatimonadaceae bacterium]|nr:thiamine phosphate synthase [Gemmatimonadaceae bacterium]
MPAPVLPQLSLVPILHVVTNDRVAGDPRFLSRASAVLEAMGNRGALHLRGHAVSGGRLYTLALALAPLAAASGAWLVVNDRVDVALATGVRRVQLTARSLTTAHVHALPGEWHIGLSVHEPAEAAAAEMAGASWVIAGNVFATPSHAGAGGGLPFVRAVAAATRLPVIAIGGIRPDAVAGLRHAGAAGVAVIRGVWDAGDAVGASTAYLTAYDAGGHE